VDFNSFVGYAESLAFIYAWTFLAAGGFALIEKLVGGIKARRAQASEGTQGSVGP
jgi:hypothetical protein